VQIGFWSFPEKDPTPKNSNIGEVLRKGGKKSHSSWRDATDGGGGGCIRNQRKKNLDRLFYVVVAMGTHYWCAHTCSVFLAMAHAFVACAHVLPKKQIWVNRRVFLPPTLLPHVAQKESNRKKDGGSQSTPTNEKRAHM
jgi:hypothetical protein